MNTFARSIGSVLAVLVLSVFALASNAAAAQSGFVTDIDDGPVSAEFIEDHLRLADPRPRPPRVDPTPTAEPTTEPTPTTIPTVEPSPTGQLLNPHQPPSRHLKPRQPRHQPPHRHRT